MKIDRIKFYNAYEQRAKLNTEEKQQGRLERLKFTNLIFSNISGLILDIGAADGSLAEIIRNDNNKVISIDIAFTYCKKIKKKGLTAICADAENIPFKNSSMDKVICTEILEHTISSQNVADEIFRVLKKSGDILVSVPNDGEDFIPPEIIDYDRIGHLRGFSDTSLTDLFKIKFIVNRIYYFKLFTYRFNRLAITNIYFNYLLNITGLTKILKNHMMYIVLKGRKGG